MMIPLLYDHDLSLKSAPKQLYKQVRITQYGIIKRQYGRISQEDTKTSLQSRFQIACDKKRISQKQISFQHLQRCNLLNIYQ